jgi:hypothetical protein
VPGALRCDAGRKLGGPDLLKLAICGAGREWFAYPEIRRSSIEVQHESLTWRTDRDRAKILRVVLLIVSSHLAGLTSGILLRKNAVSGSLASKLVKVTVCLALDSLLDVTVWTRQGRLEAPFLQEVNVGLGTRSLVLLVGYESDL